jgi:outer membrane biosynthesis protein TonB
MAAIALRSEERIGLGVAVAFHLALVALLLWRPPLGDVMTPPDRIEVTLSDDVALKSTSPEPMSDARPDVAPELGELPPPEPEAVPPPPRVMPEPQPAPRPQPRPVAAPKPVPRPVARPAPRPSPRAKPAAKPAPRPAAKAPAKPAAKPAARPGGSRIGKDFLEGVQGGRATGASRNPPAQAAGPQVQAALASAISRQLKPHWQQPDGVDVDKIVTVLSWELNPDGSLAGSPRVVSQTGITASNSPQAKRHAEQAIRAVRLAAPFDLPSQYYSSWKRVGSFRFDWKLNQ